MLAVSRVATRSALSISRILQQCCSLPSKGDESSPVVVGCPSVRMCVRENFHILARLCERGKESKGKRARGSVCVCVQREREKENERDREREKQGECV